MHLVLQEKVDHGEECGPESCKQQISKITTNCEGENNCLQRGNSDSDTITTHEPYEIGPTATKLGHTCKDASFLAKVECCPTSRAR